MTENGNGKWKLWVVGSFSSAAFALLLIWTSVVWGATQENRREVTRLCERTRALEAQYEQILRGIDRIEKALDKRWP